jgi:hypothetical protein
MLMLHGDASTFEEPAMSADPTKIAVIGLGAMATTLIDALRAGPGELRVGAALVRSAGTAAPGADISVFEQIDALLDWPPSLGMRQCGTMCQSCLRPAYR